MIQIKPFKQTPGYCGPASLKIVLDYYGITKTEAELAKLSRATQKEGVQAEGLMSACNKLGLKATLKDFSEFEDLEHFINKGIPVLVQWFLEDDGHWSVVVGIDEENVYLQDPHLGMLRAFKLGTFKKIWFDFLPPYPEAKNVIIRRMLAIERK